MKTYIYTLLALFAMLPASRAAAETALPGQWRLHNTFDSYFQETIDTPERVYLLPLAQSVNADMQAWSTRHGQLFTLDKESGELTGYNASNYLTGNEILDIAYNPEKRYLLIIYDDYTIDILYDDDSIHSIPGLASSTLNSSKNVNHVAFDPRRSRAYLATDFGYIVVDDSKYVIPESRVYDRKLNSIARVGDWLVAGTDDGLFISPVADRHTTFESFTPVPGPSAVAAVMPLTESTFALQDSDGLSVASISETGEVSLQLKEKQKFTYTADNRDGYLLSRWGAATQVSRDGSVADVYTSKVADPETRLASWDFKDFYFPVPRRGISRATYNGNYDWTPATLYKVNAPQPTGVFSFAYSELAGMLAGNETHNRIYSYADNRRYPGLVSAYDRGSWTPYGAGADTDSPLAAYMYATYGPVVDPVAPEYFWLGSRDAGLFRVDMRDNSIEMFSHPAHPANGLPGFHAVFPTSVNWTDRCPVSAISFDGDGNLWCVFNPSHAADETQPLYCWKAADRKAGNVSAFKQVPVKGYSTHYENFRMVATKSQASRGFVAFAPASMYYQPLYLFYRGASVDDTSDDRLCSFTSFLDQDGTAVSYTFINTMYEDPATGYIWVGTDAGVFYFNPNEAIRSSGSTLSVRRPKVARNDGTNLADYLLSGLDVMSIAADGAGRKWFATNGSGLFVSSPEGSRVIDQFTVSNSSLPSDVVFSVGFDPTGNAVWIGGAKQTSTYFCDATPAAEDYSKVLAFPNPVRPEYSGPVTIQGLMDDSLVKIADASGAVVKELGLSNGGMALWDLTDMQGRQVSAGVYYVLSSTSTESQPSAGNSTKILVVR